MKQSESDSCCSFNNTPKESLQINPKKIVQSSPDVLVNSSPTSHNMSPQLPLSFSDQHSPTNAQNDSLFPYNFPSTNIHPSMNLNSSNLNSQNNRFESSFNIDEHHETTFELHPSLNDNVGLCSYINIYLDNVYMK